MPQRRKTTTSTKCVQLVHHRQTHTRLTHVARRLQLVYIEIRRVWNACLDHKAHEADNVYRTIIHMIISNASYICNNALHGV